MMTTTTFEHSPLDPADPQAIHVLELLPSRDLEGPIRCELYHRSLEENFRYEAVSYTWGDPALGHTVFINGSHTLDVTPNCLETLKSLRRRFRRRRLWIDAICIDQRENDISKQERDRQVSIMGAIFHQAQRVLVWLGPAEPSTARTISRLKLIANLKAFRESTLFGSSALRSLGMYFSNKMIDPDSFHSAPQQRYQAFASMMCSPWWQRVWTLQEQVLGKQCVAHHGRQSIPISSLQPNSLSSTIELLTNGDGAYNHLARHNIRLCCQRYSAFQQSSPDRVSLGMNFVAKLLLEVAFLLEAKHPIDKVYGLYSIFTIYCNLPLSAPDYNKAAEDVFEEIMWSWIKTRGDLSILKLATRPGCLKELPSWVPAWHQQHPGHARNIGPGSSTPERLGMLRRSHFNWNYSHGMSPQLPERVLHSGDTQDSIAVAELISSGKLRVLHARFVGRVSVAIGPDTSREYGWYRESLECHKVHLDWCRLIRNVLLHSPGEREEALHEMFRSILYPGIHQFGQDSYDEFEDQKKSFESFRAWVDFLYHLIDASGSPTPHSSEGFDTGRSQASSVKLYLDVCLARQEEEAVDVLKSRYRGVQERECLSKLARQIRSTKRELDLMRNHRLCVLDNENMLAVTDYWCQEGDEIFVFPGTDSPFVLRKQPEGDCYRLVGPALVDRLLRVGYQNWRSGGDDLQNIVLI